MKLTIFGATGSLGSQCVRLALAAGHQITALVRDPQKLHPEIASKIHVETGNALDITNVAKAIPAGTEAILFAIGIDKHSPEDLCTDVTKHIVETMRKQGAGRLVWCGGGSTLMSEDQISFGAKFIKKYSEFFLPLRHHDKAHQYAFLDNNRDVDWIGVRPLQMKTGPHTGTYRLGYDPFNGFSNISFADCADAMLKMLNTDTWLGKAPIIQY